MADRLPVTVLTGFLGAGKTTLLKRILTEPHGHRIAVVVNELSDVDIDGELVMAVREEVVVLTNGCVCCTIRGDLVRAIAHCLERSDALDHVVIETTGLAEPGPIAQSFYADAGLAERVRLDGIVTVVDAANLERQLRHAPEAGEQVAFADLLVLNKTDLVDHQTVERVARELARINAVAPIVRTSGAALPIQELLRLGGHALAAPTLPPADHDAPHDHGTDVTTVGLQVPGELSPALLYRWIGDLLAGSGEDLFRLKGLLAVAGVDQRVLVQAVHRQATSTLEADWGGEERHSRLVLIGRNLDRAHLEADLRHCLATHDPIPRC